MVAASNTAHAIRNKPSTRSQTIMTPICIDFKRQQVLNPTPLSPTPATCHNRKRKLRCSYWNAALQKMHINIGFSVVRNSLWRKAALRRVNNDIATSIKLRCRKAALSCRFPATFRHPHWGTAEFVIHHIIRKQSSARLRSVTDGRFSFVLDGSTGVAALTAVFLLF